jgi:tryptophan-associated transmembrane protein
MIVVLLLGTALALWGATEMSWLTGDQGPAYGDKGTGGPSFASVALLALASLAGVFAVGGWARRLLGAIVTVAGGWVCWEAMSTPGSVDLLTGRGLGLLGGVLFMAAGVLIVVHAAALPTMGARYERANTKQRSGDADKDMWDGLSEGEDPTAEGPRT